MKFVWDTLDFYGHCVVPMPSLYSLAPSLRKKVSAGSSLHFFQTKKGINMWFRLPVMLIFKMSVMQRCRLQGNVDHNVSVRCLCVELRYQIIKKTHT